MRPDFAALVGSRICHDLISPIGAIGNGVELLSLTQSDTSAEMDLISESVDSANARIRYFRIAYGAAADDQLVSRSDIVSILAAAAHGGRFAYFWEIDGDQLRPLVRGAFLMLQCFETALPLGGDIHIRLENDTWVFSGQGRRVTIDDALWASLTAPDTGFEHRAAQVQFALLPEVLAAAGRTLVLELSDDQIVARF
ncbi:histidine phosphotransferase family protein [Yoonia sp.]|jgi:histidine phosphotransferase ChpT|uniref:histidine phosphotransferase family protein n=1 Tax=Yoonia sp. TaxID=2212373 RepID=UPI0025E52A3C|nr:histidine phosphotransferase family protein [Yoonia sp.]